MRKRYGYLGSWLTLLLFAFITASAQQPVTREDNRPEIKTLELAHAQHEIIILLIKDNQFSKVWEAIQELLELPFPPEQEQALVKSLTIITEQLFQKGRVDLSHQILDKAVKVISSPANQGDIFLVQARLYKKQGLNYKAIEAYRKYQERIEQLPK
jgi:tetratricopeptide (TPR) repeat protein